MSDAQQEALQIEGEAWKLITAFDDAAEAHGITDRRVQYAALIMMMTSFCQTSPAPAAEILTDFCQRVGAGAAVDKAVTQ
jgi:hypothetical protein